MLYNFFEYLNTDKKKTKFHIHFLKIIFVSKYYFQNKKLFKIVNFKFENKYCILKKATFQQKQSSKKLIFFSDIKYLPNLLLKEV